MFDNCPNVSIRNCNLIADYTSKKILGCIICDTLELKEILCDMLDSYSTPHVIISNIVYTDARMIENFSRWDFLHNGMKVNYICYNV